MLHKDDDESVLGLTDGDVLSCDRFKVAQVVRNFVSNAIKFTPSGGKVTVHACFKGDITYTITFSHTITYTISHTITFFLCSKSLPFRFQQHHN